MDKELAIKANTLNDIIIQRLVGMSNNIDLAATTTDDRKLELHIKEVLKIQKSISKELKDLIRV